MNFSLDESFIAKDQSLVGLAERYPFGSLNLLGEFECDPGQEGI
jgi:hypothetical protein